MLPVSGRIVLVKGNGSLFKEGLRLKPGSKTLSALPLEEGNCSQRVGCDMKRKPRVFPALVPSFLFLSQRKIDPFPWGEQCNSIKKQTTAQSCQTRFCSLCFVHGSFAQAQGN